MCSQAGENALKAAKCANVGKLTLSHIDKFEAQIKEARISSNQVSPKLLPNYKKQKNIETFFTKYAPKSLKLWGAYSFFS